MRILLVFFALALFIVVIIIPAAILWEERTLPPLESEFDLDRYLKAQIEGDRMASRSVHYDKMRPVTWNKPDITRYPKDFISLYLAGWECPYFFQTPRESGAAWLKRAVMSHLLGRAPPGDGRCEWAFANNIAVAIHIQGGMRQSIAAYKIHNFLQRDQLVAYDLATMWLAPGVIGIDDGTWELTHRSLESMKLDELAELSLILPPEGYWGYLRTCSNATLIRQNRDWNLGRIAAYSMIPQDRMRAAQAQPLACTRRWLNQ